MLVRDVKARLGSLFFWLSVVGPGIITANVDNDAGGITTYSLAGAHYGAAMLWTLVPITFALIVVQEMVARMGAVTGKGLSDLIRENFGVKTTFYLLLGLLIANLANTVGNFAGVAAAGEVFGISKYITVPLGAVLVWWLVVKGTYKTVEKVFLAACVFYVAYVISGIMAKPHWGELLRATVTPSFSFEPSYIMMVIGMVGTTIAPWMQFYLQSSIVEKGIRVCDYRYSRLDVVLGCFVTDIVAWFIVAACAATLFAHGIQIETAKDAAMALRPLAGKHAAALFGFGLFNASLFAASILPLSTAYSVCEGMGWESGVNKTFKEAPWFFGLYTGLIVLAVGIVLIPNAPLILMMYLSQVANGILLPFILIYMQLLINDRRLMGNYVNSRWYNVVAWVTTWVMIALTIILVVATFFPKLFD
ncbi:MAG: Nramp family divalent metal transporter [Bacillota bacterium]|nr:Nramp family divalent metal transporter [Bacillota bacterium]